MRLISTAIIALLLAPAAGQAHTVNTEAASASALLMLVAVSQQHASPATGRCGDLSRSPQQIRRLSLQAEASRRAQASSLRVASAASPSRR